MGRLLVIDDDANIRHLIRVMAAPDFEQIDEAPDGDAALAHLAAAEYDAVVLDIMLPGRNGFAVYDQIRSLPSPPRVIVFSALSSHFHERFGDDVIIVQKPYAADDMAAALRKVAGP